MLDVQTRNALCLKEELRGTFVAKNLLSDLLTKEGLTHNLIRTPLDCHVDLWGTTWNNTTLQPYNFNVEIKQRYKNDYMLKRYPDCELRVDKLERMKAETKEGEGLFYIVFLNQSTAYIFDCNNIDWDTLQKGIMDTSKFNVDPSSPRVLYEIYNIPTCYASYTLDCSEYFKLYNITNNGNNNN